MSNSAKSAAKTGTPASQKKQPEPKPEPSPQVNEREVSDPLPDVSRETIADLIELQRQAAEDAVTSDPLPDVSRETIATPEEEEGDGDGEEVLSETIVGESIMFEAGEYDESCDSCYHLNPSWKFACMIQGNETCGFLGGNQLNCPYYADRDECRARLEQLPRRKQYGLNPLGLKMPGDE